MSQDSSREPSPGLRAYVAQIFNKHGPYISKLAWKVLYNKSDVVDVLQEAIVRILEGKAEPPTDIKTRWLAKLVINICQEHNRRAKRSPSSISEKSDAEIDRSATPFYAAAIHDDNAKLHHLIEQLPAHLRLVIELSYFNNTATDEIARILEIEPKAVIARLFRARLKLKALIDISQKVRR